jgi:hypothetical protein
MMKKTLITIITNHDFLKGSRWLIFHFWLMDMYILTKGQGLEWHMYFLIDQLEYNGLFDYIHIIKLYNFNQNDQWSLIKWNI